MVLRRNQNKVADSSKPTFWTSKEEKDIALRWLLGLSGTWIILSLMVDLGDTAEFAVALAMVITGSVVLQYGPDVFKSLNINTGQGGKEGPMIPSKPVPKLEQNATFGWAPVSGARVYGD